MEIRLNDPTDIMLSPVASEAITAYERAHGELGEGTRRKVYGKLAGFSDSERLRFLGDPQGYAKRVLQVIEDVRRKDLPPAGAYVPARKGSISFSAIPTGDVRIIGGVMWPKED